jgi:hypothetical protein
VTAVQAALLVYRLAPVLRDAIVTLIQAIKSGRDVDARAALEAALRAAFVARQR